MENKILFEDNVNKILIPLEEYKELLQIKGKYEEIKGLSSIKIDELKWQDISTIKRPVNVSWLNKEVK